MWRSSPGPCAAGNNGPKGSIAASGSRKEHGRVKPARSPACRLDFSEDHPVERSPWSQPSRYRSNDARANRHRRAPVEGRCTTMTGTPHADGLAEVKFLTVAEVASLMRVSKMTVYRLVH